MNIQSISAQQCCEPKPAFKGAIATLSEKNLGQAIKRDVVEKFNAQILPQLQKGLDKEAGKIIAQAGGPGRLIKKAQDFVNKVDFYALAAGSGSRFKELAETVGNYNKISLPFKLDNFMDIHMLDFAMAMGKFFIGNNGVKTTMATNPTGSFGDVVEYYRHNPIKDIVLCCGDNVFADPATKLMPFFTKLMNNPNKHLGLMGVARTPEIAAKRFGVLGVEADEKTGDIKLTSFAEKPPYEVAQTMTYNGKCIANTGMFYMSKESLQKVMDEINSGVNNIYKRHENGEPVYKEDANGNKVLAEPYDFAEAVKYVHKMTPEWFGVESKEAANVMIVDKWEDVGEPKAMYEFCNDIKNGIYRDNFSKSIQGMIGSAFNKRIHVDDKVPYINFSKSENVFDSQIQNAKEILGVKIII